MTPLSALRAGTAALALFTIVPPAAAQFMPAPTPTADALAAQMRQLGANPRDVYALIAAGELSTQLGDPAAALGFFGRAQAVDPSNPRIAAGKAGALVLLERPGEALRLYDQAERGGVAMTPYLAQRGLAYDLIGQPGYAQRDYRRALTTGSDDETVRRLALSLGISGRRDEAMTLLDPLLRRSDRGAWRARACILAITGDVAGAQRIATSMMAGGAALSPFLSRLQWLSPAERAFAVHFGQLSATIARANDARLAPALAALPVEPQPLPAPVVTAATTVTRTRQPNRRESRRRRAGREPIAVAAVTPTPVPAPTPVPSSPPTALPQLATREPVRTATISDTVLPQRQPIPSSILMQAAPVVAQAPPVTQASATVVTPSAVTAEAPRPTTPSISDKPAVEVVTLRQPVRPQVVAAAPPPPPPPPAEPAPTVATPAPVVTTAPEARTPEVARRNTTMLASIIETIAVPASELDVTPPARPAPRKPVEAKPETPATATKKADPKKPDPKKVELKKPDPAKTDPARWWVQVAGGANEADLGKDWKRLTTKSPAAFRGKSAWTTPLRATNRLLAGPFKSQGEASAFVNLLVKDGASAFAWQSPAGQKIERLAPK